MSNSWESYYEVTRSKPPHERTVAGADLLLGEMSGSGSSALDFGSGAGRDSRYLAERGFAVTAVDADQSGFGVDELGVECVESEFGQFDFETYDLVSSQWAISFCSPSDIGDVLKKLLDSVRPGGVFTGNFFGVRDEWATNPGMSFFTQDLVKSYFADFEIVELLETEKDGHIADGSPKHWHYFDVIARRK